MIIKSGRKFKINREQSDAIFEHCIRPYLTTSVNAIPRDFNTCVTLDKETFKTIAYVNNSSVSISEIHLVSYGHLLHQARGFSIQAADYSKIDSKTIQDFKKGFHHNLEIIVRKNIDDLLNK